MLFPEQLWQWLAWSAPNAALHTREEPRCCGERRVGPLGLLFLALPFLWESGGKCLAILLYFCCTVLQQSPEVSIKIELTVSGNGCCHVSERSTRGDTAKQKPPRWGGAGEGSSKKKRKLLVEQRENWQVCIWKACSKLCTSVLWCILHQGRLLFIGFREQAWYFW